MGQHRSSFLLIGLAYLGFVSLGLPDGLLGVAWPSIRTFFQLQLDALGALLVLFTIGYLLSSFSSGQLLARLNVGALLALSCLATATSLLGYALTPRWRILVALGVLSGLGAGAIDRGAAAGGVRGVDGDKSPTGARGTRDGTALIVLAGILALCLPRLRRL